MDVDVEDLLVALLAHYDDFVLVVLAVLGERDQLAEVVLNTLAGLADLEGSFLSLKNGKIISKIEENR